MGEDSSMGVWPARHPRPHHQQRHGGPEGHRALVQRARQLLTEERGSWPILAKEWKISADNRVYTFKLRDDIRWHDGAQTGSRRVTAYDFVATLDLIQHPRTLTPLKAPYEMIAESRRLGDDTVEITLKRPIVNGLGRLSFKVVPTFALRNPDFFSRDDPFAQRPIGTGAYRLRTVTGEGEVVMEANPDYHAGRPHIDEVILKPFADKNVLTQSLLFSSTDMIVQLNPRDIAQVEGDKRFNLYPYNALSYTFFGHNFRNPHLRKKEVRQAIAYAINRAEMLDSFYEGRGTVISGPFAPGSWAYNLDVKPVAFDPGRAKELLSRAGYGRTGSDGYLLTADGAPLQFTLKGSHREGERDH